MRTRGSRSSPAAGSAASPPHSRNLRSHSTICSRTLPPRPRFHHRPSEPNEETPSSPAAAESSERVDLTEADAEQLREEARKSREETAKTSAGSRTGSPPARALTLRSTHVLAERDRDGCLRAVGMNERS